MPFNYSQFNQAQLEALRRGQQGAQNFSNILSNAGDNLSRVGEGARNRAHASALSMERESGMATRAREASQQESLAASQEGLKAYLAEVEKDLVVSHGQTIADMTMRDATEQLQNLDLSKDPYGYRNIDFRSHATNLSRSLSSQDMSEAVMGGVDLTTSPQEAHIRRNEGGRFSDDQLYNISREEGARSIGNTSKYVASVVRQTMAIENALSQKHLQAQDVERILEGSGEKMAEVARLIEAKQTAPDTWGQVISDTDYEGLLNFKRGMEDIALRLRDTRWAKDVDLFSEVGEDDKQAFLDLGFETDAQRQEVFAPPFPEFRSGRDW
jgi:hypothetical protein